MERRSNGLLKQSADKNGFENQIKGIYNSSIPINIVPTGHFFWLNFFFFTDI
jgi:hypothetical protein